MDSRLEVFFLHAYPSGSLIIMIVFPGGSCYGWFSSYLEVDFSYVCGFVPLVQLLYTILCLALKKALVESQHFFLLVVLLAISKNNSQ